VAILEACHWQIKGKGQAADRLGLNPSTLRFRMKNLESPGQGPADPSNVG